MSNAVVVLIEDGTGSGSGGGGSNAVDSPRRALASASITLTLAILGRRVNLPDGSGRLDFFACSVCLLPRPKESLLRSLCCSSVLPVPFAFSRLGILPGLGIMLVVAGANALAGTLLLRAAGTLNMHSFEGLAEAVGGRAWRVSASAQHSAACHGMTWLGVLCAGLCGTTALSAGLARAMISKCHADSACGNGCSALS